jgi:taurine dioxygenase
MYKVEPLAERFGAAITGCDVNELDTAGLRALVTELHRYRVLVIPDQHLAHPDQVRVSRAFGELEPDLRTQHTVPGFPEILMISNIFEDGRPIGLYDGDNEDEWHVDSSWKETMNSCSLLYSVIAPATGGETRFADATSAYDDLPAATRQRVDGLRAVHSMALLTSEQERVGDTAPSITEDQVARSPDVAHPLVRVHPITGERSLLLGSMIIKRIDGMGDTEASNLLAELHAHVTARQYVYRHRWDVGDLVIWDNLGTMHTASPCDSSRHHRLLYRTTVR